MSDNNSNNNNDANNNIQDKIIKFINHFSEIKKLEFTDKFIQSKFIQISDQEIEFRKFVQDFDIKLSSHADDLIKFSNYCEQDNTSSDELLISLRKLSEAKLNKSKSELVNKLETVKNCLIEIINEIIEYDNIIIEQKGLNNEINKSNRNKDEAMLIAKGSVFIVGIAAIVSIPLTAGASLASLGLIVPAKIIATSLITNGAGTAVISTAIAGVSSVYSDFLNYQLKNIKKEISQFLKEMQKCLENINIIITYCKSHFENQISEIEEVKKIVDIIKKIDDKNGRQLIKPIVRTMSTRARKNSECYNVDIKKVF